MIINDDAFLDMFCKCLADKGNRFQCRMTFVGFGVILGVSHNKRYNLIHSHLKLSELIF